MTTIDLILVDINHGPFNNGVTTFSRICGTDREVFFQLHDVSATELSGHVFKCVSHQTELNICEELSES